MPSIVGTQLMAIKDLLPDRLVGIVGPMSCIVAAAFDNLAIGRFHTHTYCDTGDFIYPFVYYAIMLVGYGCAYKGIFKVHDI